MNPATLRPAAKIRTEQELADFIADLRGAAAKSRRTGGSYVATLVGLNPQLSGKPGGVERVAVEIHLPSRLLS